VKKQAVKLNKERLILVFLYQPSFYELSKYFNKHSGKVDQYQAFLGERKPATWRHEMSVLEIIQICSNSVLPGHTVGS
jgi:hypothetical protein